MSRPLQQHGPLLALHEVAVGYPGGRGSAHVVLSDVHASVEAGQLIGLVGPNGAGKSTLLRSIAGLQPMLGGRVEIAGRDVAGMKRRELAQLLAAVLTDRFDPGRLLARDVVGLGRHPHSSLTGRLHEHDRQIIADALAAVSAEHLAEQELAELSDGQRQRVMIARALAQEPQVMLLDEPTAFLDPPGRVSVLELTRRISRERGIAVIVCTHDIEAILSYADEVWVAGRSEELHVGGPEDLAQAGLLAAPFAAPGVHFDLATLTFQADSTGRPRAVVDGVGMKAALGERCLRRAGYDVGRPAEYGTERSDPVQDSGAEVRLSITDGQLPWTLTHPEYGASQHRNLADVHALALKWLQRMGNADDAA
ncbi:ABC transporter ATP-binding protein [Gephyromycinifex aptenodytis]|uniref:ABC transporter ATP-binding protein n=1 Tax=Gephyromycinifex aptenodytis TaxID=2716227 RepID=UPI001446843B|nr:ABC transporter ATP-binding protein [Gephyromycinifex aptenodytis]